MAMYLSNVKADIVIADSPIGSAVNFNAKVAAMQFEFPPIPLAK
jgi:hypothetical protein